MNPFEELLVWSDSATHWYYQGRMSRSKRHPARLLPPLGTFDLFLAGDVQPNDGTEWVRFVIHEDPTETPRLVAAALRQGITIQLESGASTRAAETLREILSVIEKAEGLEVLDAYDRGDSTSLPGIDPPSRECLPADHVRIPTVVLHSGMQEVIARKAFPNPERDFPQSEEFGDRSGNRGYLEIRRGEGALKPEILPPTQTVALSRRAWEIADELDDGVVDTLDLVTVTWLRQARGPKDGIDLYVDDALEMLGFQRKKSGSGRRGGFKPEQRAAFIRDLFKLDAFWLVGESVSRDKKKREVIGTRVFTVSGFHGQTSIPLDPEAPLSSALNGVVTSSDCRVSMIPGKEWGPYLFSEEARATLGWLATQALAYDPRYYGPEKRLLRYFCRLARIAANKDEPDAKRLKVETLTQKSGITIHKTRPTRSRDRLEAALDRLQEDGLVGHWQYSAPLNLRSKKWLRQWLAASIDIEWSNDVKDRFRLTGKRLPKVATPLLSTRVAASRADIGELIAARRKALRLSQTAAADQIGVSQKSISNLERGSKASLKVAEKVRLWLSVN